MEYQQQTEYNINQGLAIKEGVCRAIAQASVFLLDSHKIACQLCYRKNPYEKSPDIMYTIGAMLMSSLSAGISYTSYFSICQYKWNENYNIKLTEELKGILASTLTSIISTPLGNCMRVIQGKHIKYPTLWHAGKKIISMHRGGISGLYCGYGLGLLENIIEMQIKTIAYVALKNSFNLSSLSSGILVGIVSAFITNPIDIWRTRSLFAATAGIKKEIFSLAVPFKGAPYKAMSSACKNAIFFALMESQNK